MWKHGTLTLPVLLLVKFAGSTHFPVFFCQLWEKTSNILPANKAQAIEGLRKAILGVKCTASRPRNGTVNYCLLCLCL